LTQAATTLEDKARLMNRARAALIEWREANPGKSEFPTKEYKKWAEAFRAFQSAAKRFK
jgi:hypothetical protein